MDLENWIRDPQNIILMNKDKKFSELAVELRVE
jgi:hypothetical protein